MTIEAQQNCTVLHFLLVVIPCFLLITPLLQGHMFFNSSKKHISKSRVLWSEGSGTCPPVKVPPPKGVVVISNFRGTRYIRLIWCHASSPLLNLKGRILFIKDVRLQVIFFLYGAMVAPPNRILFKQSLGV